VAVALGSSVGLGLGSAAVGDGARVRDGVGGSVGAGDPTLAEEGAGDATDPGVQPLRVARISSKIEARPSITQTSKAGNVGSKPN
jgi:hypothetical protein